MCVYACTCVHTDDGCPATYGVRAAGPAAPDDAVAPLLRQPCARRPHAPVARAARRAAPGIARCSGGIRYQLILTYPRSTAHVKLVPQNGIEGGQQVRSFFFRAPLTANAQAARPRSRAARTGGVVPSQCCPAAGPRPDPGLGQSDSKSKLDPPELPP